MKIDLTEKQFRRLLDLVYVGNWVMNSTRGDDRIREYDDVESTVFANCLSHGMVPLVEAYQGELIPSRAFAEGGIHEAIMAYEDTMFFEILAQELALRDMDSDAPTPENVDELRERMDTYLGEFEHDRGRGTGNIFGRFSEICGSTGIVLSAGSGRETVLYRWKYQYQCRRHAGCKIRCYPGLRAGHGSGFGQRRCDYRGQ